MKFYVQLVTHYEIVTVSLSVPLIMITSLKYTDDRLNHKTVSIIFFNYKLEDELGWVNYLFKKVFD